MTATDPATTPMDDLALIEDGLLLLTTHRVGGSWGGSGVDECLSEHGWTARTPVGTVADAVDEAIGRLRRYIERQAER